MAGAGGTVECWRWLLPCWESLTAEEKAWEIIKMIDEIVLTWEVHCVVLLHRSRLIPRSWRLQRVTSTGRSGSHSRSAKVACDRRLIHFYDCVELPNGLLKDLEVVLDFFAMVISMVVHELVCQSGNLIELESDYGKIIKLTVLDFHRSSHVVQHRETENIRL